MRRVSLAGLTPEADLEKPDGFWSGRIRFAERMGARQTGASLWELAPGQSMCPYHYEYAEEEWALVLEGEPTVRTPEGSERAEPSDLLFFPTGPAGAHQIRNDTAERVRVLMWSPVVYPAASAYVDSGKVGLWTGDDAENLIVERSSGVDYFHGEPGAER